MLRKVLLSAFAALAACAALSGCASNVNPSCPTAAGLVDASSLTKFAPGASEDPAHMLYRVELTGVSTDCTLHNKTRIVDSTLALHFRATRGPSATAVTYSVPYFVAIHSGADITAKRIFTIRFHFAPGQTTAIFSDHISSAEIHVALDKMAFDYQLLAGLQLNKRELEYNRRDGL